MSTSNWSFSPIVHWPLSGAVTQDISPTLLFRAKDTEVETRVLREVASYGRQIGKLSEVLLAIVQLMPQDALDGPTRNTVAQLQVWAANIERIKKEQKVLPGTREEAKELMEQLRALYPGL